MRTEIFFNEITKRKSQNKLQIPIYNLQFTITKAIECGLEFGKFDFGTCLLFLNLIRNRFGLFRFEIFKSVLQTYSKLFLLIVIFAPEIIFSQIARWDTIGTEKQYFSALARADEITFKLAFEYPFLELLTEKQKDHYSRLATIPARKSFINLYWKISNPNPIMTEYEWLEEFIRRVIFVKTKYSSRKTPYFDDRGKYFLRYGEPSQRFVDRGGIKHLDLSIITALNQIYSSPPDEIFTVPPNETWLYQYEDKELVVHFAFQDDAFREIPNLSVLLADQFRKDFAWQWYTVVQERAAVLPNRSDTLIRMQRYVSGLTRMTDSLALAESQLGRNDNSDFLEFIESATGAEAQSNAAPTKTVISPGILHTMKERDLQPHRAIVKFKKRFEYLVQNLRVDAPDVLYFSKHDNKIKFFYDISQFRDQGGATRLEITLLIPIYENLLATKSKSFGDSLKIKSSFLLSSQFFEPLFEVNTLKKIPMLGFPVENLPNVVEKIVLIAPPNKNQLAIQVKNAFNSELGFIKEEIQVRDFRGKKLMLSDLQLLTELKYADYMQQLPVRQFDNLILSSYPYLSVKRSLPLYCYFEIYNLNSISNGTDFLDTELKILEVNATKQQELLTIKNRLVIGEETSKDLIAVDLSKLENGAYKLQLVVSDPKNRNIFAEASKELFLTD